MLAALLETSIPSWIFPADPDNDQIPRPDPDDINAAELNGQVIYGVLHIFRDSINRQRPKEQFPEGHKVVDLIDNVLQALLDLHGGERPHHDDKYYRTLSKDKDEKAAMVKLMGRWTCEKDVDRQFWAFQAFGSADRFHEPMGLKWIQELKDCLEGWMDGKVQH